ncbi:restriction endonuclease subunit S [Nostoc ellipsosporum NOK]|nr:restriction endonuclease subunit S [Nostoc ellipsosporum NOK]
MTEVATTYQFLQFVEFTRFNSWDVEKNTFSKDFSFGNPVQLSEILSLYKQSISHQDVRDSELRIISKIDFSGNLHLRESDELNTYKGDLYLVPTNTIIYSKINVRHGCIYFNVNHPFAVSNEYPCFTFDPTKVVGQYLILLLRSKPFKKQINSLKVGIGKARVKIEEFLSLTIPLPSIPVQKALVEAYDRHIAKAMQLEIEAKKFHTSIDQSLGITSPEVVKLVPGKLSFVEFKHVEKWGLDQLFNSVTLYDTLYKVVTIQSLCKVGSGGTPSRSNASYYRGHIPWVKTGEVIDEIIYDTEEKVTEQAVDNSSAKIYQKGSLLVAMYGQGKTRGRTAKLGVNAATNQACAVLYDIKSEDVIVDYLWVYLMNEYDRLRSLASGNNQPNLNADMIKKYPVVLPPKDIQEQIVEYYFSIKERIKDNSMRAELLRNEALEQFENTLFHSKK